MAGDMFMSFDDMMGAEPGKDSERGKTIQPMRGAATRHAARMSAKRYASEKQIEQTCGFEIEEGESIHVISQGDIDSLTFLRWILRMQRLEYCLVSSWCIGYEDAVEIVGWIKSGRMKKCDVYVGEIFKGSYRDIWDLFCEEFHALGCGRVAIFRNHAKVMAGTGDWSFAITSSANINTNPRAENTVVTRSDMVFRFYKDFYDRIRSFERNFDGWKPFELKAVER